MIRRGVGRYRVVRSPKYISHIKLAQKLDWEEESFYIWLSFDGGWKLRRDNILYIPENLLVRG